MSFIFDWSFLFGSTQEHWVVHNSLRDFVVDECISRRNLDSSSLSSHRRRLYAVVYEAYNCVSDDESDCEPSSFLTDVSNSKWGSCYKDKMRRTDGLAVIAIDNIQVEGSGWLGATTFYTLDENFQIETVTVDPENFDPGSIRVLPLDESNNSNLKNIQVLFTQTMAQPLS